MNTILIGTIFPLIVEAFKGRQMSVGRPYFDSMVVPVGTAAQPEDDHSAVDLAAAEVVKAVLTFGERSL